MSFFLSRSSQKAPDHPRTQKCHFTIGKSTISSKNCLLSLSFIYESGKITENRAEMAREVRLGNPNVTRRLPERYPNVTPTFTVGQALVAPTSLPRAHLHPACLARAPLAKCSFFRAKKKCVHVFFARRGDCRSRKMLQNKYLLAKIDVDTAENELCTVWAFG